MLALIAYPNIDPIAFSIGPFAVRWYALAYIAALIFAVWYVRRLVSDSSLWAERAPTATPAQIDDVFIWLTLGVVLGGRIGYVLFYNFPHFLAHPLDMFRVWEGGMSFHGGFLGVVIALVIYARRIGTTLDRLLDLGAAAAPVGPWSWAPRQFHQWRTLWADDRHAMGDGLPQRPDRTPAPSKPTL
jgi:phosphatidylglycerol:prolipoprotein diacylglycerol transferase